MDSTVDLAPGAEDNPLAVRLSDRIRHNLRDKPHKARDFRALRGTVHIVALDAGTAMTMRFDHGRLTIHDGAIGVPVVTFSGDTDALLRLADVPLTKWLKLPIGLPFDRGERASYKMLLSRLASGELKIYGLAAHPRLVLRLIRIVSADG